MILLDTNFLIPALLEETRESLWLKRTLETQDMIFCPIVISEFLTKASSQEARKIRKMVDFWGMISLNFQICSLAAQYRYKFKNKTKPVYLLDCMIAACAKVYRTSLVTHNVKDYPMKDIKVVDPV